MSYHIIRGSLAVARMKQYLKSILILDEPGPIGPNNAMGPGSPRPPTMIERHLNATPSMPPTLPEIRVPERSLSPVASLEFPVPLSARESPSPFGVEFSNVRTPPPAGLKLTSSPLATSAPASAKPTVILSARYAWSQDQ